MTNSRPPLWQAELLSELRNSVSKDEFWTSSVERTLTAPIGGNAVHLAVFVEPFLQFILSGRKTVESRFSLHLCPPHNRVQKGDIILLKKSGGPVVGISEVASVWFYELDPLSWKAIHEKFSKALCADNTDFWRKRKRAAYATLMRLSRVTRIHPIRCDKRDRRGWVVLASDRQNNANLFRNIE